MSDASRVLIIIPAFNEEATIADVIESIKNHCPDYDVVVVDDGSQDATAKVVMKTGHATLLKLPHNLGIGGAMQTGYKFAYNNNYDIAVQCDADGQHPVEQLEELVGKVEAGVADIVIGSRYVADTGYTPSLVRRVGKSVLSRWIDFLIGGGITDTTSGFRAANRKVLQVFAHNYPEDYPEPEALVILHKHGLSAAEVPVNMHARQGGTTSIRPHGAVYYMIKVGMAIFIDLFRRYTPLHGDD